MKIMKYIGIFRKTVSIHICNDRIYSSAVRNVHLWLQILADIGHSWVGVGGGELVVPEDRVVGQEHTLGHRLGASLRGGVSGVDVQLLDGQWRGPGVVLVLEKMIELRYIRDDAKLVRNIWIYHILNNDDNISYSRIKRKQTWGSRRLGIPISCSAILKASSLFLRTSSVLRLS